MSVDLDYLAGLFIHGFPVLNADDQVLALILYRILVQGKPVTLKQLAQASGTTIGHVNKTLNAWSGVFFDNESSIVALWGLTINRTQHRLQIANNSVYTWCAWDSLFLPELLGATVKITSRCAETDTEIKLTLSPSGVESMQPKDVVISFLTPDIEQIKQNVAAHFCHFVHFFRSCEAGEQWVAKHPDTFIISIETALAVGRKMNAARYSDTVYEQVKLHE